MLPFSVAAQYQAELFLLTGSGELQLNLWSILLDTVWQL